MSVLSTLRASFARQSMGGHILAGMQAYHRTFDGVAILGSSMVCTSMPNRPGGSQVVVPKGTPPDEAAAPLTEGTDWRHAFFWKTFPRRSSRLISPAAIRCAKRLRSGEAQPFPVSPLSWSCLESSCPRRQASTSRCWLEWASETCARTPTPSWRRSRRDGHRRNRRATDGAHAQLRRKARRMWDRIDELSSFSVTALASSA